MERLDIQTFARHRWTATADGWQNLGSGADAGYGYDRCWSGAFRAGPHADQGVLAQISLDLERWDVAVRAHWSAANSAGETL